MDIKTNVFGTILVLMQVYIGADAFSRVPSTFSNTTWYSNVHGDVQFTTTEMQNWAVNVGGQSSVNWLIQDDTRYSETVGYLMFRSESNYTINGTIVYAYMCTKLERLKEHLYTYYNLHVQEDRFGGERVMLLETSSVDMFDSVCDTKFEPNTDDIHVLARKGVDTFTTCPQQVHGHIGFTAQTTNTTNLCAGVKNMLDGCSDQTKLQISSTCSYPLLFTANGSLSCLTEQESGSDGIVYLLNMDNTVDNVNTFRFSCMAISADGTIVSIVPQSCLTGHTSTSFHTSTTGNRLFVKTRAMCNTQVTSVFDEYTSLWIRIGIPVGIVLLFLVIAGICAVVVCYRVRQKEMGRNKKKHVSSSNGKNGKRKQQIVIVEKMRPEKHFENPYITVDESPRKAITA